MNENEVFEKNFDFPPIMLPFLKVMVNWFRVKKYSM